MNVQTFIKFSLYKSLILPILLKGYSCVSASRAELQSLERFQKEVARWITGIKGSCYGNQLRLLNILPLPMLIQMSDILFLANVMTEYDEIISLPERQDPQRRITEVFKPFKTRTEKARGEFVFRTCRLVNRIEKYIDISKPIGLKSRLIKFMQNLLTNDTQKQMSARGNSLAIETHAVIFGLYFNILQLGPCALQLAVNPQQQQQSV